MKLTALILAASTNPTCADISHGVSVLQQQFDEVKIWSGTSEGKVFSLWVSRDGETWSITVNNPQTVCLLESGGNNKF